MMTKSATALRWAVHQYFSAMPRLLRWGLPILVPVGDPHCHISSADELWGGPGTAGLVRHVVGLDIRPEHTFGRRLLARI
jgi:hypothetical protein